MSGSTRFQTTLTAPFKHSQLGKIVVLSAIFLFSAVCGLSMPANPAGFTESQPDGDVVDLHIHGDEHYNWIADEDGFTVLKDRGWFVYAERGPKGKLVPTGHRVGKISPAHLGLTPRALPDQAFRRSNLIDHPESPLQTGGSASASGSSASQWQGTLNNLVILLRFADHSSRSLPTVSDIDILMNEPGGHPTLAPTGSVWDIFQENSYGLLSLESTVYYWVDLPQTEAYYAGGNSGLTSTVHGAIRSALDTLDADPNINFSNFDRDNDGNIDAITFLHSGYAAEWGGTSSDGASYTDRIWSHKWSIGSWYSSEGVRVGNYHISPAIWGTSGNAIGRVGVICHETGHFLGLPDLYDGNDSDGDGKSGNGIGSWGLMANSWGFDNSQRHPPHLCAWSKTQLGWMNPLTIDTTGTYSLTQATSAPQAYRIEIGYPTNEYLLIENRQPAGIETAMPQGGLAIFHIDETASHTDETHHYRVALLQADGARDLERGADRGDRYDVFHAGYRSEIGPNTNPNTNSYQGNTNGVTNNRIYNISSAGYTMSFDFQIVGADSPPNAPFGLNTQTISYDQIHLSWADDSTDENGFKIEQSTDGSNWSEIATVGANTTTFQDTGLQPSTGYSYRVRAYNLGGNSAYSNSVSATTNAPPPPPAQPTGIAASSVSDTEIALSWNDNANDETGYYVDCSLDNANWELIATLGANAKNYNDTALNASTQYFYRVRAYSSWGQSTSTTASTTTDAPPPFEIKLASSDLAVSGTVSGTYARTHSTDGSKQVITEIESGGKPRNRRSYLDHRWQFSSIRGGLMVSFSVSASAPSNSENDNYEFQYSVNGGSSWSPFSPALIVNNGFNGTVTRQLPQTISGNVQVRVIDTNTSQGNRSLDRIEVDQLFIRSDIDANDTPPAIPTNISATLNGNSSVVINWTDNADNELGYDILRSINSGNYIKIGSAAANATSFADSTVAPANSYSYRVAAYTVSFEALSSNSNSITTPDSLNITNLSGGKRKGAIYVDIAWSGGNSFSVVDIYRSVDGGAFTKAEAVTANDGSYRDDVGLKGGHIITYKISTPDGNIVSIARSISF